MSKTRFLSFPYLIIPTIINTRTMKTLFSVANSIVEICSVNECISDPNIMLSEKLTAICKPAAHSKYIIYRGGRIRRIYA